MHSYFRYFVGALALVALCSATKCTGRKRQQQQLLMEADSLNRGIDREWRAMERSDDNRLFNLRRLLEEIRIAPRVDTQRVDALQAFVAQAPKRRYTQQTIAVSDSIDAYDNYTTQAWEGVKALIRDTPGSSDYQLVRQLAEEVQAADDSIIIYRHNYDVRVDAWNGWVKQHAFELKALPPPYNKVQQRPVFRIQE